MLRIRSWYSTYGFSPVSTLPLDKIEVAGTLTPSNLRNDPFSTSYGLFASSIISSEETFREHVLLPPPFGVNILGGRHTRNIYGEHLEELQRCKVVRVAEWCRVCNSYFAVEKDECCARAIFNGIPISSQCRVPPSVRLLEAPELVKYYKGLSGRVNIGVLDIRHWFHQIGICHDLGKYFGVKLKEKTFLWNVLPMGFSWSPFIAQAFGWSLIIEALDRLPSFMFPESTRVNLPFFIPYTAASGEGRIFLCYDNVTVMGNSGREDEILHAIEKNLKRRNIAVKTAAAFTSKQLLIDRPFSVEHPCCNVGIQFQSTCNSRVIRIAPKTITKWQRAFMSLSKIETPTRRQVAQAIGILIADSRVRLKLLMEVSQHIKLLRVDSCGWNEPSSISPAAWMLLRGALEIICQNQWTTLRREGPRPTRIILAADASDTHAGFVAFDQSGIIEQIGFDVPSCLHIFTKELIAAKSSILWACARYQNTTLILLEDNSAAATALRNLYTLSESGAAIIEDVIKALASSENVLLVSGIRSEDNPADEISRRKATVLSKVSAQLYLLKDHSSPTWKVLDNHSNPMFGGVRHCDFEDTLEELEMDNMGQDSQEKEQKKE